MATGGVRSPGSSSVPGSISSDYSILNTDRSTPGSEMEPSAVDLSYLRISLASLTQGITLEESIKMVETFMKENAELRETVKASNVLMKQQVEYLEQFRDRQQQEQASIREKHAQARSVILNLRDQVKELQAQKSNLESQIEQYKESGASDHKEVAEVKGSLEEQKTKVAQLTNDLRMQQDNNAKLSHAVHEEKLKYQRLLADKLRVENQLDQEMDNTHQKLVQMESMLQLLTTEKQDLMAMNQELMTKQGEEDYVVIHKKEVEIAEPAVPSPPPSIAKPLEQASVIGAAVAPSMVRPSLAAQMPSIVSRQDVSISQLLVQLQEERQRNSELLDATRDQSETIMKLKAELSEREKYVTESSAKLNNLSEVERHYEGQIKDLESQLEKAKDLLQSRPQSHVQGGSDEVQQLKAQVLSLVEELKVTQQQHQETRDTLHEQANQYHELEMRNLGREEQTTKDKRLIETLQESVRTLESSLQHANRDLTSKTQSLKELRKNFDQLMTDYHNLLDKYEEYRLQQENAYRHGDGLRENREFCEKIDELTAQLVNAEETLQHKQDQIDDLKYTIQAYEEKMTLLNAQAQVYKADFEVERKAREDKHGEMIQAQQERDEMRARYQELQEELAHVTHHQLTELQRRHNTNQHQKQQPQQPVYINIQQPTARGRPGYPYPGPYNDGDGAQADGGGHGGATGMAAVPPAPPGQEDGAASPGRPEDVSELRCPGCQVNQPDTDSFHLHLQGCDGVRQLE